MFFVVHLDKSTNEIVCKPLHEPSSIKPYIEHNNLTEEDYKVLDGNRMIWNQCYNEWRHAVISSCGKCKKDTTGYEHGSFPCSTSLEGGCPDKGDGGW